MFIYRKEYLFVLDVTKLINKYIINDLGLRNLPLS